MNRGKSRNRRNTRTHGREIHDLSNWVMGQWLLAKPRDSPRIAGKIARLSETHPTAWLRSWEAQSKQPVWSALSTDVIDADTRGGGENTLFRHKVNEHVELGLLELRDADCLFALVDASRTHLREWLPFVDATRSVQDIELFIQAGLQKYASNNGVELGIWNRGEMVGVLGLHYINWTNRLTSIGYWLGAEFQGHGIMTASCRSLIDILFTKYGLNRVEIRVAPQNLKSRAIPERLGFQNEGCQRDAEWLYDHYVDHVTYGMLARDW